MKDFIDENPLFLNTIKWATEKLEETGYLNLSHDLNTYYDLLVKKSEEPVEVSEEEKENGTFRAIMSRCLDLNKIAEKAGLTFSVFTSLICDDFDVRLYAKDAGRTDILSENLKAMSSKTFPKRLYAVLDKVEEAIEDYKVNEAERLEKQIAVLNEKLTESKKQLKKIKK